jgi:hypothetical protein
MDKERASWQSGVAQTTTDRGGSRVRSFGGGAIGSAVEYQATRRAWHLADEAQAALIQASDEGRTLAGVLIEKQPVQRHVVGPGAVDLLQGDLPLGTVDQPVGDAGLTAAGPVIGPPLGQEQLGVDEGLVAPLGDAEVDGDDAVLDLAQAAEVLALDAGVISPCLRALVSSMTPTVPRPAGSAALASCSRAYAARRSRTAEKSQAWSLRNSYRVRTAVLARRAMGSTDLRGRSQSRPRT